MRHAPQTIRFRGREEKILDVISVRGRNYLALEQLSHRGAWRVFDRHAGIHGDYRVLYRIPHSQVSRQRIETLRRLTGPTANRNFPYISDCVRQGDELIVVLSWVWGRNLRELLAEVRAGRCRRPSVTETVRLIRGLAHGLSHYHRRAQLVHGDVSPANLVVTTGTKNLVLVDFGSAWPIELSAAKEVGDGITPPYAAPERIGRHALEDFRSDQFSLAVVAYEMLTLEMPYDGAGGKAGLPSLAASMAESFVPPSQLIADSNRLPQSALEQLDEVLRVGLSLHPDGRFATRSAWLSTWDALHRELQKGGRLSGFQQQILSWMESLASRFGRDNTPHDSAPR